MSLTTWNNRKLLSFTLQGLVKPLLLSMIIIYTTYIDFDKPISIHPVISNCTYRSIQRWQNNNSIASICFSKCL